MQSLLIKVLNRLLNSSASHFVKQIFQMHKNAIQTWEMPIDTMCKWSETPDQSKASQAQKKKFRTDVGQSVRCWVEL